jgi:hypothetical protein
MFISLLSANMFFHIPFFLYSCFSSHSLFLSLFNLISICTSVMVTSPRVSHITFFYLYISSSISFLFYSTCLIFNTPAVPQQWRSLELVQAVRAGVGVFWVADLGMGVNAPNLLPERCLFNSALRRRNCRFRQRITDEQLHNPTL